MGIEEKVSLYSEIQAQRRAIQQSGQPRNAELDRQSVELMLDIEKTHTLYLDARDEMYKVREGAAPRLYLGYGWRSL